MRSIFSCAKRCRAAPGHWCNARVCSAFKTIGGGTKRDVYRAYTDNYTSMAPPDDEDGAVDAADAADAAAAAAAILATSDMAVEAVQRE